MKFLLDTHILLWALGNPRQLPRNVRAILEEPNHEILFSSASIWEIAIKAQIGRENFQVEPSEIVAISVRTGFTELPVRSAAACLVATLPKYHKDPFDRLLIAQAIHRSAELITVDPVLGKYAGEVRIFDYSSSA